MARRAARVRRRRRRARPFPLPSAPRRVAEARCARRWPARVEARSPGRAQARQRPRGAPRRRRRRRGPRPAPSARGSRAEERTGRQGAERASKAAREATEARGRARAPGGGRCSLREAAAVAFAAAPVESSGPRMRAGPPGPLCPCAAAERLAKGGTLGSGGRWRRRFRRRRCRASGNVTINETDDEILFFLFCFVFWGWGHGFRPAATSVAPLNQSWMDVSAPRVRHRVHDSVAECFGEDEGAEHLSSLVEQENRTNLPQASPARPAV